MGEISEKTKNLLTDSFSHAYREGRLQENYFIHRFKSPYDTYSHIKSDQNNLLKTINTDFDKIFENIIRRNSTNSLERQQIQKLKIFILGSLEDKTDNKILNVISSNNLIELTKIANEIYTNQRNKRSYIYGDSNYLNSYFIEALHTEINQFKKNFLKFYENINSINIDKKLFNIKDTEEFTKKIANENFWNELNNKNFQKSLNQYLEWREKELKENHKINIKKLKEKGEKTQQSIIRYNMSHKILVYLRRNMDKLNKNIIITTLNDEYWIYSTKGSQKISATTGFRNEGFIGNIIGELLEKNFSKGTLKIQGAGTGSNKTVLEIDGEIVKLDTTIKTDVSVSLNTEQIKTILNNSNLSQEVKDQIADNLTTEDVKLNFSAKNYNPNSKEDITAQSNSNLGTYATLLARQFMDANVYRDLINPFLHYFLLNETVQERKKEDNFRSKLADLLSKAGFAVLTAQGMTNTNNETDEIDFLIYNQHIIPTALILKEYISFLNKNYKEQQKFFYVSFKSQVNITPSAEKNNNNITSKDKMEYYSENYLSQSKAYGFEQFKKYYLKTRLSYEQLSKIIMETTYEKAH